MRVKIRQLLIFCSLVVASVLALSAQGRGTPPLLSTTPYDVWTADQLAKPGNLGNYGNHTASIQRRDVGAAPETHDGFSHFLMFTSGAGNFIVGGQIVDGPDGKKIVRGGDTHKIVIGEMYHIPIKTAHWVVPNPGMSVTYWVTNIYVEKP
jgi:mannose-6-phosphate isomerase-like protein (cupin superfamily)